MNLYLAAPLFTAAERTFNVRLRAYLTSHGHTCWLPQEKEPREFTARAIFEKDVEGIDWCDVVVACMDGPDPDSGTCWECGYAYRKKPILVYRSDFRGVGEGELAPFNLMLTESATMKVHTRSLSSVDPEGDLFDSIRGVLALIAPGLVREPHECERLREALAVVLHFARPDTRRGPAIPGWEEAIAKAEKELGTWEPSAERATPGRQP